MEAMKFLSIRNSGDPIGNLINFTNNENLKKLEVPRENIVFIHELVAKIFDLDKTSSQLHSLQKNLTQMNILNSYSGEENKP